MRLKKGISAKMISKAEHYIKTFWRPTLAWLIIIILAMDYLIAPIFGFEYIISERMFDVIELCLGVFLGARSIEKIAPYLVQLRNSKQHSDNPN